MVRVFVVLASQKQFNLLEQSEILVESKAVVVEDRCNEI